MSLNTTKQHLQLTTGPCESVHVHETSVSDLFLSFSNADAIYGFGLVRLGPEP